MEKELEIRINKLELRLDMLSNQLKKALEYIEDDPHSSLTKSRTILEQILLNIYKLEMDQDPKRIELGAILTDNQFTRKIDKRIVSRMNAIRDMCNLGVHGEKVVSKDAKIVLDNLCEVLDWYFENYETIKAERKVQDKPLENIKKPKIKSILIYSGIFAVLLIITIITLIYTHRHEESSLLSINHDTIKGKYYGLIIGINEYPDPTINDLNESIKNAEIFSQIIITKYTFNKSNVKFLKNAKYTEIIEALEYFAKVVKSEDNFLLFYAGLGLWDESVQAGFWFPSDATVIPKSSWLSNSTLCDYLGKIKSKHTLLISDACFSGSFFKIRSDFNEASLEILDKIHLYDLASKKAMTSGTLMEFPDKSVFLKYMFERLDNNSDKYLSSEQLFSSLRYAIINNSPYVPQFGVISNIGDEGGDYIFVLK